MTVEDPVSLEYITRHVAGMKQRYTQSSGRRPFGISCLLTGKKDLFLVLHIRIILGSSAFSVTISQENKYHILVIGFDDDGTPHLYQTDPAGVYAEWKANAIGRNAKTVREFLEKNWTAETVETEEGATKLAVKALLEVVQLGGKNLEVAVMRKGDDPRQMQMLPVKTIEKYVAEIEEEKEKEANEKNKKKGGSSTTS